MPQMIGDPLGLYGALDKTPGKDTQLFKNTGAAKINNGDVVILEGADTSAIGVQTTTAVESRLVVGFADADIEVDAIGPVVVRGYKEDANVATGTAVDTYVGTSATAGRTAAMGVAALAQIGAHIGIVVGAAAAANKATVYVCKL